jgi:hypothetical protein
MRQPEENGAHELRDVLFEDEPALGVSQWSCDGSPWVRTDFAPEMASSFSPMVKVALPATTRRMPILASSALWPFMVILVLRRPQGLLRSLSNVADNERGVRAVVQAIVIDSYSRTGRSECRVRRSFGKGKPQVSNRIDSKEMGKRRGYKKIKCV